MAAEMWRIPASKVVKGGGWSVIQDNGMLRGASVASNGNYLFSEVGAGVQPLALIGYWHEVLNFLAKRPARAIENLIHDLPDIYMGISYYRPGQRFVGLFPLHDAVSELVKGATGFVPGTDITDAAGTVGDAIGIGKSLFGKKKKVKVPRMASNELYLKFSYLQEEGMSKVGNGKITFEKLHPITLKALSAKSGIA